MKRIKQIFWFIWGLPQNLIGAIVYLFLKRKAIKTETYKDSKVLYTEWKHGAMSLGLFIFMFGDWHIGNKKTLKHEYGHSIQSKILGPLYLIVIGLPSLMWAGFIHKLTNKSYYWFYPEAWADKLGGVNR